MYKNIQDFLPKYRMNRELPVSSSKYSTYNKDTVNLLYKTLSDLDAYKIFTIF